VSAVIYAAIVVIWLIVLVPMWLRRHEAALDERSSERFDGAMRVLARRSAPAGVDRRYVVMPRRSAATPVRVSELEKPRSWRERRADRKEAGKRAAEARTTEARATEERTAGRPAARPASTRAGKSGQPVPVAVRRRRTLVVLLGLSVLCAVLSVAGALPVAVQLVPELLLVTFVVHLRRQAKVMATTRGRRPAPRSAPRVVPPQPVVEPAAEFGEPYDAMVEPEPPVETVVLAAAGSSYDVFADDDMAPAVPQSERTWEPKPVPPPTYSLKPPAPALDGEFLVVDDLDRELADDADGAQLDLILDPGYDAGYDAGIERQRAVND
jgi:hypothetical protein